MKQTVRPKLKEFTIIGIKGLKDLKQRILFLEEENEALKNQIAKDQPFVEQCKAWCKYHASKRKARKEEEAYNRLLKIRELEKEIKALKKNRQERG